MSDRQIKKEVLATKHKNIPAILIIGAVLAVLASMVFAAQDKYTVQVCATRPPPGRK
jgi:hypothetical protein